MEFRDTIKYLRRDIGLTQLELANALHICFTTVSRWETGKTTPNRSMITSILELARTHEASGECMKALEETAFTPAKDRPEAFGRSLYSIEHASLSELIDEASFPLYVCDMETDDILYINAEAQEMIGCPLERTDSRKCYKCIMHRDEPCEFCHKNELVEDRFICRETRRNFDGSVFQVHGKLIKWNGRRAHVSYVMRDDSSKTLSTTPGGIAVVEIDMRDAAGSMRTVYYNDSFFSYSGYTRDEYDALLRKNEMHFLFEEDVPVLMNAMEKLCGQDVGENMDITVRCHTKDGGYRWLLLTGQLAERRGSVCVINIVLVDITKRKTAEDRQRISEEMLRLAAETDKRTLITYNVKANTCIVESRNLFSAAFGERIGDMPRSLIERGVVKHESEDALNHIFSSIRSGESKISASLQLRTGKDEYQWFECNAGVVLDVDGKPDHAVLVFHNITQQRIKEAVFKKWQNSIRTRPKESYTLFRCNLSRNASIDEQDGELLKIRFSSEMRSFNDRTKEYAEQFVCPEDRQSYVSLLNSDTLLAMFYRGEHMATMEYREISGNGEAVWRQLTVEMVEYLNSADVQAFLMYEDIDAKKKDELKEKELAQSDPLTGALNRNSFCEKVEDMIGGETGKQHALLMIDMDGFKLLNDSFGHVAGDQALLDITAELRSLTRDGDLVCRLGGDEFLVWLRDVPYDAVIAKTAQQICDRLRKAYSAEVQISASVGVAVYPRDGNDFDELYSSVDKALFRAKRSGKDGCALFSAGNQERQDDETETEDRPAASTKAKTKRRLLIVDDSDTDRKMLSDLFDGEYLIETAKNGTEAMMRLRHFGPAISVVLLELAMPRMDGYEVLKRIQNNVDIRTIPVIAVGGEDGPRSLIKAIEHGAADYITKPVDPELIRLRVQSAVSKAENERLRAQNSYLQLQRDEELKFHTVLESTGTVVVEYDWRNHVFVYDSKISNYLAGKYDHRGLWTVFLLDMVADSTDVKTLQDMLLTLANNRDENKASKLVMLKTPEKKKHWFRMNVYKSKDSYGLAEKMIITFNDVHEEVLANEKLMFQATHDELTGLYNRAGFIKRAAELIAAREPGYYVISCIDIEKFKVINDQYGTEKGDEVLRSFARALTKLNDSSESIYCRVMADNFAVLYPKALIGSSEMNATHREAERLDGLLPSLKIYVGRYIVDDKSMDISAIYDRAAIAMDTVKGRYDSYIATFDESMRTSILRQQQITGQMKHALESGQFEVWFQPQYDHAAGLISGAEALVRWRHPKEGIIFPADFIPAFERNGFIYEVDKFVWEQGCALLRDWIDRGLDPVPVSVNVSRYDVYRDDLINVIKGLVKKYDIPGGLLRLEITESAFSKSTDQIIHVVRELIELGFIVEIDDFGSGYSSLNTLKDVPAQVLKMDMRFLENDSNAQRGGSIIESVVRMARWLGMSLIAEGVESIEQADYLRSIGCDYVQGFLYSRPVPAGEYEKLLKNRHSGSRIHKPEGLETWNNNAFWNPKSIESLIFNSYVGGACIFEYCGGKTELLRYNEGYAEIFGPFSKNDQSLFKEDIFSILDEDNGAVIRNSIETALKSKKESVCENELAKADGTRLYVRTTLRQIAQAGDRSLFYCVVADITAQRAAERGEKEAASRIAAIMDNMDSGITAVCLKDGKPEMIFSNDRYYSQLGYTKEQFAREVPVYFQVIHPGDRDEVWKNVYETLLNNTPRSIEYRCIKRDGSIMHVRSSIAACRIDGVEGNVMINVETDISELVKAQKSMIGTDRQLRFVNELARGVLSQRDNDTAIYDALRLLLEFAGAQRSYIVEFDFEKEITNNSYEVCAEGVESEKERLQGVSFSEEDPWYTALTRRAFYKIENTADLEDIKLRELLTAQGIRSLVLAPLWRDGRLLGFAGVDNPALVPEEIGNLTAPADYLTILLTRRDMDRDIERESAAVKRLVNERSRSVQEMLPVALSAIMSTSEDITFIKDKECRYVIFSRSGLRAFGFENEESVIGKTNRELFGEAVAKRFAGDDERVFKTGKPLLDRILKIPVADGDTMILNTSKYPLLDDSGNVIGIYCICHDVTEQHRSEFELKTLLNFIPSGILKYSADEKQEFAYVNRNFVEALGYTEEQFREKFRNSFHEMVWAEDRERVEHEIRAQESEGKIGKFDYRIEAADGRLRWFHDEGTRISDENGKTWYYVTLVDVSEQKETEAKLRLAEEEYRFAAKHSNTTTCRFNVADRTLTFTADAAKFHELPKVLEDVPYARVKAGRISPDTAKAYIDFYEGIIRGEKEGGAIFKKLLPGGWRWISAHETTIFSNSGKPVSAVISYADVTEQQEKEAVYKRWQQRLMDKGQDAYTLYRCNLNKNRSYDPVEGTLISFVADDNDKQSFNDRTREFAGQYVLAEDRKKYIDFVNSDRLLANYHRGKRADALEFRGKISSGDIHWLRLSVELVQYPHSTDVEAYLMYEDINEDMLEDIQMKKEAETDPLTGLLNRAAFTESLEGVLASRTGAGLIAVFMLDMDGFKLINDSFGHAAGDQVLINAGQAIRSVLREGDLVCRMGGDEFLIGLRNMPDRKSIIAKAKQICRLTHKTFNLDIRISISIGIAVAPEDGNTFEELYHKADKALYFVKENGKDNCVFYSEDMVKSIGENDGREDLANEHRAAGKRKMLIVEDDKSNRNILKNIFKDEFEIDTAENGREALVYLRRYRGVNIVLLDLILPEMDGFAVLDKMQDSLELQSVPVIVVSGMDDRETNLRAIQCGAADFVTKPVDADLLRVRVASAISKAENEKLHLQNQALRAQRYESERVRAILEDDGTVVTEYEPESGMFRYGLAITRYIAGNFDDRALWDILTTDNIMPPDEALILRGMTEEEGRNAPKISSKAIFLLKTPTGEKHSFRVKILPGAVEQDGERLTLLVLTDLDLFKA